MEIVCISKAVRHLGLYFDMKKTCIIIDDVNQEDIIKTQIEIPLKKEIFSVEVIYVCATDPDLLDDESNLSLDKLRAKLTEIISDRSVDVVATDFDLSDDNINGKDVAELVHRIRANISIIMYSGDLPKVIKAVIGDHATMSSEELIEGITKFYKLNIVAYTKREGYPSQVIKQLKNKEAHTTSMLLGNLRKYPQYKFRSCYPAFMGKTFDEIAQAIEQNTPQGLSFQNAIFEQLIAYMIKVNEDE